MSKKRLMQITHDLAIGGLQQVVVNLCRSINKEKFHISVVCMRSLGEFAGEVRDLGIQVYHLPQKENGTNYFAFVHLARLLKEKKIEIIHTHNTQPFVEGTIAAKLAGVKTIVHTEHARDFPDKKRYMLAEFFASLFANKVVGVSDHTVRNLYKFEKISLKKLIKIENGICGEKFQGQIDKAKKKNELEITVKGPVIGVGVRLTDQKGISFLLQAMPTVIRAFPEVLLIIAGKGLLEYQLKKECFEIGINHNVRFLGPRTDIHELLQVFDLYVLPSIWEGLPMVLLEAMAAGCPIVATDVGGVSDAVKNGINGSLVRPADPAHLSQEIIRILKNDKLRAEYRENGLSIFNEKFSAEAMALAYERLYLQLG